MSNVAFNSADLTRLFYDGCRPLIRKNSSNVLMCSFGSSYQWYHDGVPVTGATSQTLDVEQGGDYYAGVTSLDGEPENTDVVNFIATGFSEVKEAAQFYMSPNPFSDQTTLHFSTASQQTEIRITDLSGRGVCTLLTHGENTISLKRENLLPGIYMVTVLNNNRPLHTQKLILTSE